MYERERGREREKTVALHGKQVGSCMQSFFGLFLVYHQITQKAQVKSFTKKKKKNLSPSLVFECFLKNLRFFSICMFSYCSDSKWEASWTEP